MQQHHLRAAALAALCLAACVAGDKTIFGCGEPHYDSKDIDVALLRFYKETKGATQWPDKYKLFWGRETGSCAWDGDTRKTPSPFGTRCINGGAPWNKLPPTGTGGLQYLEHLSGMAEGPIPPEFKTFFMIDFITLHGNKLTGPIWDTAYHCFLHRLDLSSNQLSGPLGDTFMKGSTQHSELINLGNNKFNGPVPASIATLKPLAALLLNDNEFSGDIPDLSPALNIRHLDLSNNKLSGKLGDWVGAMDNLAQLDVGGNDLTGELPATVPKKLSRFTGSGNKFSGTIPKAYGAAPYLRHFNCSGCKDLVCPTPDLLAHLPFSTHCKPADSRAW
jgi:hypothetical protein